ncbi:hypothetical protein LguiB_026198 [Lonicera macranthoides]
MEEFLMGKTMMNQRNLVWETRVAVVALNNEQTLAFADREPIKTDSDDLFSSFEQLYSAQPSGSQPHPTETNEPIIEDPLEAFAVPNVNPAPPQSNHAHDNHPAPLKLLHLLASLNSLPLIPSNSYKMRRSMNLKQSTKRFKVLASFGTSKGIMYLHSEVDPQIFYQDIKTNIQLDYKFTAKVSDFGISRLAPLPNAKGVATHISIGANDTVKPHSLIISIKAPLVVQRGFGHMIDVVNQLNSAAKHSERGLVEVCESRPGYPVSCNFGSSTFANDK